MLKLSLLLLNAGINFVNNKKGVTAIEYGILAAGVAVVIGALVSTDGPFATTLQELFDTILDQVPTDKGNS